MKIGTDGVLLGAWVSLDRNPSAILDIGTGTGIIALQLAQRSDAEIIDAIEIDAEAYQQAVENFENSEWCDRLFCYHASLQEFVQEFDDKYDLIISNPPFYNTSYETENVARNKARFTSSLSFESLIDSVTSLLSENGMFSLVLPYREAENFIQLARDKYLNLIRVCHVKGQPNSEIKRSLLEFSFDRKEIQKEALVIETSRHLYTQDYIDLVQDFYLKM